MDAAIRKKLNEIHSATIDTQAAIVDLLELKVPLPPFALQVSLNRQRGLTERLRSVRDRAIREAEK